MNKRDCLSLAVIFCVAAFIFSCGYILGYVRVIERSQAYLTEGGSVVAMCVDGREYHYQISPAFYDRLSE